MSLTLNIIEHELLAAGQVERTERGNPSFEGVRLFLGRGTHPERTLLYVCDSLEDSHLLTEQGVHCVFVTPAGSRPSPCAALSVQGSAGMLQVFNLLLDAYSRYDIWEREMDCIVSQPVCLQELVDASAGFLRNNTVVVDPALKLLAYTQNIPCDDPITMELISHGYHTEENIRKFKLHKRFKPWSEEEGFIVNETREICKYVTVVRSFKTREGFSLIVVMMCNELEPSGFLLDVYSMFCQRVGVVAEREYPDDKPSGNAVDSFLKDLLRGEIRDERSICERSRCVGIPYEARFCLFYVPLDPSQGPMERLLADLSLMAAPAKTLVLSGAVVILCFNCQNSRCALHCEAGTCPLGHRSLSSRLNGFMERFELICGRSSKFTCLAGAATAFRQAQQACRLGLMRRGVPSRISTPRFNWGSVISFDRCCMDYLAEGCPDGLELALRTYAGLVVDALAADDAHTGTDNYTFLYEYLMNERRTSVVAEKLHMHRNNVKYRIDRIEELFGIDTDDPALRFDMLLAYRLREAAIVLDAQ